MTGVQTELHLAPEDDRSLSFQSRGRQVRRAGRYRVIAEADFACSGIVLYVHHTLYDLLYDVSKVRHCWLTLRQTETTAPIYLLLFGGNHIPQFL